MPHYPLLDDSWDKVGHLTLIWHKFMPYKWGIWSFNAMGLHTLDNYESNTQVKPHFKGGRFD